MWRNNRGGEGKAVSAEHSWHLMWGWLDVSRERLINDYRLVK